MLIGVELAKLVVMDSEKKSFSNFQFIFLSVAILIPTALLIFRNQHYFNSHWLDKLQSTSEYYHELLYDTQNHNIEIINKLAEIDPSVLEVHVKTDEIEEYIEVLKTELINESNGINSKTKDLADKYNIEGTQHYLIGERGVKGKAYELELKLNDYASFMSKISGSDFPAIALDGEHDTKIFHGEGDHSSEDFVTLNFGKCNLVVSIAVLTELQLKVISYEQQFIHMEVIKYFLRDIKKSDSTITPIL